MCYPFTSQIIIRHNKQQQITANYLVPNHSHHHCVPTTVYFRTSCRSVLAPAPPAGHHDRKKAGWSAQGPPYRWRCWRSWKVRCRRRHDQTNPDRKNGFMSKLCRLLILKTNKLLHCEICWENWCTDLVTNQPLWSVRKRVLMGIQPNSVTVLMYVAVETEEDHESAKEVQPAQQVCELDNHRKSCAAWCCFFSSYSDCDFTVPVPSFSDSCPSQVLTRTPCPGPEEPPSTTCPSREAFSGTSRGWKSTLRGLLMHVWFL